MGTCLPTGSELWGKKYAGIHGTSCAGTSCAGTSPLTTAHPSDSFGASIPSAK
jgi:hypothetical protein